MDVSRRIKAFSALGKFLSQFEHEHCLALDNKLNELFFEQFHHLIKTAKQFNGWFTEENVRAAIVAIANLLQEERLNDWTSRYAFLEQVRTPKRIGVIMAGNIPMVAFHDFLCVLISGNTFVGKITARDQYLIPEFAKILIAIDPGFSNRIEFTEGQLKGIDAVIATGSNNSSRYFEYYFGKYPHIIRKNRNSAALLDGTETKEELSKLGKDIFQYFGLGCRNVSKLFIPSGYHFDLFFESMFEFKYVLDNNKYANNYDYNKTVYLMKGVPLLENGFLLLKEDIALASPVSMLNYEYYSDDAALMERLHMDAASLQCIVTHNKKIKNATRFGETQQPGLDQYADRVDTLNFLGGLN